MTSWHGEEPSYYVNNEYIDHVASLPNESYISVMMFYAEMVQVGAMPQQDYLMLEAYCMSKIGTHDPLDDMPF